MKVNHVAKVGLLARDTLAAMTMERVAVKPERAMFEDVVDIYGRQEPGRAANAQVKELEERLSNELAALAHGALWHFGEILPKAGAPAAVLEKFIGIDHYARGARSYDERISQGVEELCSMILADPGIQKALAAVTVPGAVGQALTTGGRAV